jgi:hypothetical protein
MGVSGQHHALAMLYPRERLVWMQRLEEKSSASVGDQTPVNGVLYYGELKSGLNAN